MSTPGQPPADEIIQWLEKLQGKLQHMLAPDNPISPEQLFQELMDMSRRFLFLSQAFLDLSKKATRAATALTQTPNGEVDES